LQVSDTDEPIELIAEQDQVSVKLASFPGRAKYLLFAHAQTVVITPDNYCVAIQIDNQLYIVLI